MIVTYLLFFHLLQEHEPQKRWSFSWNEASRWKWFTRVYICFKHIGSVKSERSVKMVVTLLPRHPEEATSQENIYSSLRIFLKKKKTYPEILFPRWPKEIFHSGVKGMWGTGSLVELLEWTSCCELKKEKTIRTSTNLIYLDIYLIFRYEIENLIFRYEKTGTIQKPMGRHFSLKWHSSLKYHETLFYANIMYYYY